LKILLILSEIIFIVFIAYIVYIFTSRKIEKERKLAEELLMKENGMEIIKERISKRFKRAIIFLIFIGILMTIIFIVYIRKYIIK